MPIASLLRPLPVVAATLLLATACTSTHNAPKIAATISQGPYVALGDSYTAGPDIPNQVGTPSGCQRSDHNYPSLLAQHLKLGAGQFHDVSCSGATIANLTTPQSTGNGVNPPQLNAVTSKTAVITIGIGGNDVDFSGVLTRCVELDAPGILVATARHTTSNVAPCMAWYTAGGTDQLQQKIAAVSSRLAEALAQIHRQAPHARVYVVGYPALLPSGGTSCARKLGITADDVAFLNSEEIHLNTMLHEQAEAAGYTYTYVDAYTPSLGHDACSDQATRWIEPIIPAAPAAPLHPNALGEKQIAAAVWHAMNP